MRPKTDFLFTLALFTLFALTSLAVVITGADVYQSVTSSMERSYNTRTALAYVAEKIRQNDAAGAVRAEGGLLCLTQYGAPYGEENACLYIYEYDGWLTELLIRESQEFRPEDGQRLLEVSSFRAEQKAESLYKISISGAEGETVSLLISPYSAAEPLPQQERRQAVADQP